MLRTAVLAGAMIVAGQACAQEQPAGSVDEVVVTGTRAADRTALSSVAPVDVVSARRLEASGYADLGRALNFLEPSVNFARAATTATAANTRPITLRGLAPDQTLVLVNGKRRHANAILNVNNSIGRGSAAVDLDTIPEGAIERIEILRDGAAAQYGSDAIAGVVNIILKSDSHGGSASLQSGITEAGDGGSVDATATQGFALGADGHLTLTADVRHQQATNRALVDQRFGRVTYRIGDPDATVTSLAFDAAKPVGDWSVYGFGTITGKRSNNAAGFRTPGFSPLYPGGFLPIIEPHIFDVGVGAGVRGRVLGLNADLSETVGYNRANFRVFDTANPSLGLASPTAFDSGGVTYRQAVTDLTLSKPLDGVLAGGNIAFGAQYRHEGYKIRPGEPLAYFGAAADGFAGFNPSTPTDIGRNAYAGFVDLELQPVSQLLLTAAGRYDHYDDFGGRATWRAAARWELTRGFALRGSVGTGFRAPSLQQQYFNAIQGALSAGRLVTVATLPVSDPVARALGAQPLKPEKSRNISAGFVVGPFDGFSLTADYFHIAVDDRIALSEQLSGAAVTAILTKAGVTNFQQVRFFTNAIDTTTDGYEVALNWRRRVFADTDLALNAGYGRSESHIDQLRPNLAIPSLPLLSLKSQLFVIDAQPKSKLTFQAVVTHDPWEVALNVVDFGHYNSAPLVAAQSFAGGKTVDLSTSYRFSRQVQLTFGVLNLFDALPDRINDQVTAIASTGGSFPTGEETPIGLNGRSYYLRLGAKF
jgi:iron complex outermembrane receptor protein